MSTAQPPGTKPSDRNRPLDASNRGTYHAHIPERMFLCTLCSFPPNHTHVTPSLTLHRNHSDAATLNHRYRHSFSSETARTIYGSPARCLAGPPRSWRPRCYSRRVSPLPPPSSKVGGPDPLFVVSLYVSQLFVCLPRLHALCVALLLSCGSVSLRAHTPLPLVSRSIQADERTTIPAQSRRHYIQIPPDFVSAVRVPWNSEK